VDYGIDKFLLKAGKSLAEVTTTVYEKAKTIEGASRKFNSYYQRVKRLSDTFKKLNKNRSTTEGGKFLDDFLNRKFEIPN
jgi:hypothetical protein